MVLFRTISREHYRIKILISFRGVPFAFVEEEGLAGFGAAGVTFALITAAAASFGEIDPHAPPVVFFLAEPGNQDIGKLRLHFKVGIA